METKNKLGCFTFPAILLIALIGSGFLQSVLPFSLFTCFVLLLFTISWTLGKYQSSHKNFRWRYMVYSMLLMAAIFGLRYLISSDPTNINKQQYDVSENIHRKKVFEKGDSIMLLQQNRRWKDNYGNAFTGKFAVREQDYVTSKKQYKSYTQKNKFSSWGKLYQHLAVTDTPKLDLILRELAFIKKEKKLNQFEFAEMVVTFIQDIQYSFVFEAACASPEQYEASIRRVLEECNECCIGGIPYGIQNPIGFMGNLKGDCDTRTVIIYAILSHFGYEVAILNSDYYRHSILGLHIPAKGLYKILKGKRYYVWETTNKHFTLGVLPDNYDNIKHWNIVLTNT